MPITIVLDTIEDLKIFLRIDEPDPDVKLAVAYKVTNAQKQFPVTRAFQDIPLNATQQSQLNSLYAAILTKVHNFEGI